MGLILVLSVFLYPLVMPLLTLGTFIAITLYAGGEPLLISKMGLPAAIALTAFLGPSISRTGSGSFALPWWLQTGEAEYYIWQYALVCLGVLFIFCVGSAVYRAVVPTSKPGQAARAKKS